MSYQKVILIGNLGRDPEIRKLQSGKSVANLNIATSERYKDKDGAQQEKTEWHRVVVFAENLVDKVIEPYLKKGSKVLIEGKLQTRKWQDQSGTDKYTTEVVLNAFDGKLVLLGDKGGNGARQDDAPPPADDSMSAEDENAFAAS